MTEFGDLTPEPETNPDIINRNYAESSANVRARFKLYQYVEIDGLTPPDISEVAVDTLWTADLLPINGTIGDIGGSDGALAWYLLADKGYEGEVTVVDPNTGQFRDPEHMRLSDNDWRAIRWADRRTDIDFEVIDGLINGGETQPWSLEGRLQYRYGLAQAMPFYDDQSVDALFAMFMMYHLPSEDRRAAFQEFKRVLKPEAVLTVATSGADNKCEHRRLEHLLAYSLGIEPPPPMNAGFTSEKAADEIADYFPYIYRHEQKGAMVINSVERAGDYIRSLGSLHNQFVPTPDLRRYYQAITDQVVPILHEDIDSRGAFQDFVHRSVYIASMVELDLPPAANFEKIT